MTDLTPYLTPEVIEQAKLHGFREAAKGALEYRADGGEWAPKQWCDAAVEAAAPILLAPVVAEVEAFNYSIPMRGLQAQVTALREELARAEEREKVIVDVAWAASEETERIVRAEYAPLVAARKETERIMRAKVDAVWAAVREWREAHYAFFCPTIHEMEPAQRQAARQRLGAAEAALATLALGGLP